MPVFVPPQRPVTSAAVTSALVCQSGNSGALAQRMEWGCSRCACTSKRNSVTSALGWSLPANQREGASFVAGATEDDATETARRIGGLD